MALAPLAHALHALAFAALLALLPPCASEDDTAPCSWDASTSGNGTGRSFVVVPDFLPGAPVLPDPR